jgi:hypothetical protein
LREFPLLGSNKSALSSQKAFSGGKLLTLCNAQKPLDFGFRTRIIAFVALHNMLFSVVEAASSND